MIPGLLKEPAASGPRPFEHKGLERHKMATGVALVQWPAPLRAQRIGTSVRSPDGRPRFVARAPSSTKDWNIGHRLWYRRVEWPAPLRAQRIGTIIVGLRLARLLGGPRPFEHKGLERGAEANCSATPRWPAPLRAQRIGTCPRDRRSLRRKVARAPSSTKDWNIVGGVGMSLQSVARAPSSTKDWNSRRYLDAAAAICGPRPFEHKGLEPFVPTPRRSPVVVARAPSSTKDWNTSVPMPSVGTVSGPRPFEHKGLELPGGVYHAPFGTVARAPSSTKDWNIKIPTPTATAMSGPRPFEHKGLEL